MGYSKHLLSALAALYVAVGSAAEFDPAATATNQLGLELFRQAATEEKEGNLVLSPFSIQSALAMTYAGAEGDTRTEMAKVLHFPPDDAPLTTSFGALREALNEIAQKSTGTATQRQRVKASVDTIEWHVANRLFGQSGYEFRQPFLALVKDGYAAPFESLDFRGAAELSRGKINAWVEEQTRKKIRDLIPVRGVDKDTRLVLVNALYLKAPWHMKFEKAATQARPFHVRGVEAKEVPAMSQTTNFGYAKRDGFAALTLPYLGGELQLLILLPDDRAGLNALTKKVTADVLRDCAKMEPRKIALQLPKFRIEGGTLPLGKMLQALGMKTAFDFPQGSANFDRIAPRKPDDYLKISEVFHKTFLALDEEGTEAAAATAVAMPRVASAMPVEKPLLVVQVDHPFLFAIQHRESGMCLFLGHVVDPR
jgi:serpin B